MAKLDRALARYLRRARRGRRIDADRQVARDATARAHDRRVGPAEVTVLIIGERHRQGASRDRLHAVGTREGAVPRAQLRSGVSQPDRERAVRPRGAELHRRDAPARGYFERAWRHAVPRRDHRDAARPSGATPARARDASGRARRRLRQRHGQHARDRRNEPGPGRVVRRGRLREGPALSAAGRADRALPPPRGRRAPAGQYAA